MSYFVCIPVALAEAALDACASMGMYDEVDKLNDILEVQDADKGGGYVTLLSRDAFEVQNHRYREALQKIAAIEDRYNCGDWDEIEEAREIANEALGDPK